MRRAITAIAIATLAMLGLTACDPPMPPSVAASIAEQTFTCIEGESKVSLPDSMAALGVEWLSSMSSACTSPAMTFTGAEAKDADIILSSYPVTACKPISTVPVAVEAADVAFSLSYSSTLNLTPEAIAGILNGKITNWSDSAIADQNLDTTMPDLPIVLRQDVDKLAFEAIKAYTKQYGFDITAKFKEITGQSEIAFLDEGEIALVPHSLALGQALTTASFLLPEQDGLAPVANADLQSIGSAATQWTPKQTSDNVSVELDYNTIPEILSGLDTVTPPYQAIYPVYLNICNDSLLNRAVAFFFLRMDSQGALGVTTFTQLPERTRVYSLVAVKRGLPVPTASAATNG